MRKQKTIAAVAMTAAVAGGALLGSVLGNPLASGAQDGGSTTSSTASTTVPSTSTTTKPKTTTTTPKTTTTTPKGSSSTPAKPDDHGKGPGMGFRGGLDLEVAAKTLNMTVDELRKQLQAGKSLADIAKAQGVPKQTLIDALVKAGEAKLDEAKKNLPDAVAKAVDATPPKGGFGGFGKGMRMPGFDAAAKALGITTDQLMEQLKAGKTLAEIAKAKGVPTSKIVDALMADAKKHSAEAVKAGKITQKQADEHLAKLKEWTTKWVNGDFPKPGEGGMGGHGGGPGGFGGGPGGPGGDGGQPPGEAPGTGGN